MYGGYGYSRGRARNSKIVRRAYRDEKKWPKKDYGTVHLKRGGGGVELYGADYATATDAQKKNRKEQGFYGKGGYFGNMAGNWLSGVTGIKGLGDMGSNLENQVIQKGVGFLNGYTGSGAYTEQNALINPSPGNTPTITSSGLDTADIFVSNKEYIGDVFGSSTFQNQSYMLNPGNSAVFPWLSQIAVNFEEFNFNQLIFGFKSVTPDSVVGTTQVGSVIMVANYNSSAPNFTTKIPMMEYDGAVSGKITENVIFGVECDDSKNASISGTMYVCGGSVPIGQDPKLYFLANLQIAINQAALTGEIGELWVTYAVTLKKKKLWSFYGNQLPVFTGVAVTPSQSNLLGFNNASQFSSTLFSSIASGQQSCNYYFSSTLTTAAAARSYCMGLNSRHQSQFSVLWMSGSNVMLFMFPDTFTGVTTQGFQCACTTNGATTWSVSSNLNVAPSYMFPSGQPITDITIKVNVKDSAITSGLAVSGSAGTYVALQMPMSAVTYATLNWAQISGLA